MKTPNENTTNPQPENADELARREAEARAAMDAALQQNMDPKIESDRNLRTSNASLRLEIQTAIKRLIGTAEKLPGTTLKPLGDYLNKLALEIYACIRNNRADTDRKVDELREDVIAAIEGATIRIFWRLLWVQLLIGGIIVILIFRR